MFLCLVRRGLFDETVFETVKICTVTLMVTGIATWIVTWIEIEYRETWLASGYSDWDCDSGRDSDRETRIEPLDLWLNRNSDNGEQQRESRSVALYNRTLVKRLPIYWLLVCPVIAILKCDRTLAARATLVCKFSYCQHFWLQSRIGHTSHSSCSPANGNPLSQAVILAQIKDQSANRPPSKL